MLTSTTVPTVKGKVRPLHDRLIVAEMEFGEVTTAGGIILPSDDGKDVGIKPRWAKVVVKGHENKEEYGEGDWVLVVHGRWSRGVKLDEPDLGDIEVRLIDTKDILLYSKEMPEDDGIGHTTDLSQPSIDPSSFVSEE